MKILNETGFFANLSNIATARRNKARNASRDQKTNKYDYAQYDDMVDKLTKMGYDNKSANAMQKYLQLSNNYDNSNEADINQNILFSMISKKILDYDKLIYLGKVSAIYKLKQDQANLLLKCKTVEHMKILYYAFTIGVKIKNLLNEKGKLLPPTKIVNVINGFNKSVQTSKKSKATKTNSKAKNRLSKAAIMVYDTSFLKELGKDADKIKDQDFADALYAQAKGTPNDQIIVALQNSLTGLARNAIRQLMEIPADITYSLQKISNIPISKLRSTIKKDE